MKAAAARWPLWGGSSRVSIKMGRVGTSLYSKWGLLLVIMAIAAMAAVRPVMIRPGVIKKP
jgi:hypothetical protein